jgi:hypothetical protein
MVIVLVDFILSPETGDRMGREKKKTSVFRVPIPSLFSSSICKLGTEVCQIDE